MEHHLNLSSHVCVSFQLKIFLSTYLCSFCCLAIMIVNVVHVCIYTFYLNYLPSNSFQWFVVIMYIYCWFILFVPNLDVCSVLLSDLSYILVNIAPVLPNNFLWMIVVTSNSAYINLRSISNFPVHLVQYGSSWGMFSNIYTSIFFWHILTKIVPLMANYFFWTVGCSDESQISLLHSLQYGSFSGLFFSGFTELFTLLGVCYKDSTCSVLYFFKVIRCSNQLHFPNSFITIWFVLNKNSIFPEIKLYTPLANTKTTTNHSIFQDK